MLLPWVVGAEPCTGAGVETPRGVLVNPCPTAFAWLTDIGWPYTVSIGELGASGENPNRGPANAPIPVSKAANDWSAAVTAKPPDRGLR